LTRYAGPCRAFIHVEIPGHSRTTINLPQQFSVAASDEMSLEVERLVGYNAVSFE